jgi:hypothetical protein
VYIEVTPSKLIDFMKLAPLLPLPSHSFSPIAIFFHLSRRGFSNWNLSRCGCPYTTIPQDSSLSPNPPLLESVVGWRTLKEFFAD